MKKMILGICVLSVIMAILGYCFLSIDNKAYTKELERMNKVSELKKVVLLNISSYEKDKNYVNLITRQKSKEILHFINELEEDGKITLEEYISFNKKMDSIFDDVMTKLISNMKSNNLSDEEKIVIEDLIINSSFLKKH